MANDFTIREAEPADLPALYELARTAILLDTFSEELLREKLFLQPRQPEFRWRVYLAAARGEALGFMQSVERPPAKKAWIGMFAVDPHRRRAGVATQLYQRVRGDWAPDVAEAEVMALPGNYFHPGLDPRYTEALCLIERLGFERGRDSTNLRCELTHDFPTGAEESRLAAAGVEIRRARPDDSAALADFFSENFGPDWHYEASQGFRVDPPGLHLALAGGRIIAFSAHSTQNREWGFFGPMGTAPAARGKGVGRVLLWHCLNDLRAAGHRTAVIPWVGPISFYHEWASCRVERVFWRYHARFAPAAGA